MERNIVIPILSFESYFSGKMQMYLGKRLEIVAHKGKQKSGSHRQSNNNELQQQQTRYL